MKKLFITATGTEIGKTLVTTSLAWQARQRGEKVRVLKPVISGFDKEAHSQSPRSGDNRDRAIITLRQ